MIPVILRVIFLYAAMDGVKPIRPVSPAIDQPDIARNTSFGPIPQSAMTIG